AGRSISPASAAWSAIGVLYDIVKEIGFDLPCTLNESKQRATDDLLDQSYDILSTRIQDLLNSCGNLRQRYLAAQAPRDVRAPKGRDGAGHPFMRPAVQVAVARAVRHILEQETLEWDDLMKRLSDLDWKMAAAPFSTMWIETPEGKTKGKMASGKDHTQLLYDLLLVHLAPRTKVQISRALRSYSDLMKSKYPVSAEDFNSLMPADPVLN
ncbi:DNA sulfur modification protein DndB, partial [Streptomyces cyaneofuscatus]